MYDMLSENIIFKILIEMLIILVGKYVTFKIYFKIILR